MGLYVAQVGRLYQPGVEGAFDVGCFAWAPEVTLRVPWPPRWTATRCGGE